MIETIERVPIAVYDSGPEGFLLIFTALDKGFGVYIAATITAEGLIEIVDAHYPLPHLAPLPFSRLPHRAIGRARELVRDIREITEDVRAEVEKLPKRSIGGRLRTLYP